jgi:ketosteroid isomerase-like protein
MKKLFLLFALFTVCFNVFSQKKEDILQVMARQQNNWNGGDIEKFMEDYLKSDELQFIGSKGIVKGWQATKERYLKSYPDRATMGQLKFDILEVDFHSKKTAWVLGKWYLTRPEKGDVGGYFTLIFKKVKGKWLIVSDHTS